VDRGSGRPDYRPPLPRSRRPNRYSRTFGCLPVCVVADRALGRTAMEGLSPETPHCLLQTYRVALAELREKNDPVLERLIDELARLQAEAIAKLANLRVGADAA